MDHQTTNIDCLLNSGRLRNKIDSDKYKDDKEIQKSLKYLFYKTSFYKTNDIKVRYQIYKQKLNIDDIICHNENCDNQVSFDMQNYEIRKFCCSKCMSTSKTIKEKINKTCFNRYGMHVNSTIEKKNDIKNTCYSKYGVSCVFKSDNIKNAIKTKHVLKYGSYYISRTLKNIKYYNKEYIIQNFIDEKSQIKLNNMCEFYNIKPITVYKKLHALNISFKKRKGTSNAETEIFDYIASLGKEVVQGDRTLIGKELDIVSGDLAIEYHGLMFHSFGISKYNMFNKPICNKDDNLVKLKLCNDKNINLLQIFENEWLDPIKQNIWKSIISKYLNVGIISIQDNIIKEVLENEAIAFASSNSLEDLEDIKLKNCLYYGMYYNNELINLIIIENIIEYCIIHCCVKNFYDVKDGFPKLIDYLKSLNKFNNELMIIENKRFNVKDLNYFKYFKESIDIDPKYFYFKENSCCVYTGKEFNEETMFKNKYRKVFDAGYIKRIGYDRSVG